MLPRLAPIAVVLGFLVTPGVAENKPLPPGQIEHIDWIKDSTCQLVFFAVLEGLYSDGVPNDIVDIVLGVGPRSKGPQFDTHFVYCCPLCHPAYEAFSLYRSRQPFHGRKDHADTMGPGLEPSVVRKLRSDKVNDRLEALHGLIKRWVTLRLDTMRLTGKEKDEWAERLAIRRKLGMEALEKSNFAGKKAGFKGCAICDGSADACPLKP
jgi:hypothetical protein